VESPITAIALSHDDSNLWLAVGSLSGEVVITDRAHREHHSLSNAFTRKVSCLDFSRQSKTLLAAGCEDGQVCYWYAETNLDPVVTFRAHQQAVSAVRISPINRITLISCGLDGKIVLYDMSAARFVRTKLFTGPEICISLLIFDLFTVH
jgi:WD40 repeat protein